MDISPLRRRGRGEVIGQLGVEASPYQGGVGEVSVILINTPSIRTLVKERGYILHPTSPYKGEVGWGSGKRYKPAAANVLDHYFRNRPAFCIALVRPCNVQTVPA